MNSLHRRNWRAAPRAARGFVLITLIALLTIGGLYFFISNLSPEVLRANTQQKTDKALTQARDALLGYALQYRDYQAGTGTDSVYGYLPMPDLGEAQNQNGALVNSPCASEGCAKLNPAGLAAGHTYIGRFPWRTLGTEPLRDGHGECLWYIVSGGHRSLANTGTMNWDTLGQIDVVVAGGTSSDLASVLANRPHDRPVAIIFAPGPPLTGQDRSASTAPGDIVSQCGGNYNPANYLDPSIAAVQGGTSVYFAGNRSVNASVTPVAVAIQGSIEKDGANILHGKCQLSANCTTVANDHGLALTSDDLFGALRKSSSFRDKGINALVTRIGTCLRDPIAAGTVTFAAPTSSSASVTVGRVGNKPVDSTCDYGDSADPVAYFSHYRDQIFLAKCNPTCSVQIDGAAAPTSCSGTLIFSNQRGIKSPTPTDAQESPIQLRTSVAVSASNPILNLNWPANYLEGDNLASFNTLATTFAGQSALKIISTSQSIGQDIAYCIPAGPSQITVGSPSLSALEPGLTSLASYAPASQTITLGASDVDASSTSLFANTLFGCAWSAEPHTRGSGFRTYFRFKIRDTGDGFTFAIVDAERNSSINNRCGAARQHLGYSGNNSFTLPIEYPKIAIEFDTSRNAGFDEALNEFTNGRNDPCYRSSCPLPNNRLNSDSHMAIMYWGHQAGTTAVIYPERDDNVHGLPSSDDPVSRPAPRNLTPVIPHPFPAPYPPLAISPEQRLRDTTLVNRDFHVRVEVTPQPRTVADESVKRRAWKIEAWLVPTAAKAIASISWSQDISTTVGLLQSGTVTVTVPGHDFSPGDTVSIREAPSAFNGNYLVTASDQTAGTFKFAKYPNPGATSLTGQPVAMKQTLQVRRMKTTTEAMSSLTPVVKHGACTSDADCGSSQSCSGADSLGVRYCYAGHQPTVYDQQYIYDIDNGDGTYQDALRSIYLGFTIGGGSNDQVIDVSELFTTWLP
jgi:hypothetical protein